MAKSVREPIGIVCSDKPAGFGRRHQHASNDSGMQFKHFFPRGSAPEETSRLPPVARWPAGSSLGSYQVRSELSQ